MAENEPLGLGIIGCGAFGLFCLEAYSKMDEVRIAAVADVRKDAADEFTERFSVPANYNPAELITRDDVDIVHIATTPESHHKLFLAAARAGKHVLCEKPLAMNLTQADEMLAAAKEAKLIGAVNFVLRHNAVTDAAKAIIDSGLLGKVLAGRLTNCANDTCLGPKHWFWDKSLSGGIFIEHGVHFFDLYSHWLGPGAVIDAHTELRDGTTQEDRVICTVRHASGAVVSHYHGFDQMLIMDRTDHRLVCEMGDLRVEGWIPLALSVDAAVDDQAVEKLAGLCPGCDVQVLESYGPHRGQTTGRGKSRSVTKRIRLSYKPDCDKQAVYVGSLTALLADQIAHIRDSSHVRRITERNGRDALALATAAATLAAKSENS